MSIPNDPRSPERVLYVLRLPARLTAEEVGVLLGFHVDAVNHFVEIGLLKPLANKTTGKRMFDAMHIDGLRHTRRWLDKATGAEAKRVGNKNAAQKAKGVPRSKEALHE